MPARRRLVWALALLPLLGLVLLGLWGFLRYQAHVAPFRGAEFDAARWRAAFACDPGQSPGDCAQQWASCPRGAMVEDLVAHVLAPGRSDRAAIRAVLGIPSHSGPHLWAGQTLQDCDFYPLGFCGGLGVDESRLFVCYGPDQTIARAGHYRS